MITPDNTSLLKLLKAYSNDNNYDNYKKVVEELTDGTAYLLLPSDKNYNNQFKSWTPAEEGQTIDLGIYFVDGLKAVAVFTSEEALYAWRKQLVKYVSLPAKTIIEICEANDINRIIVDSNLPTMFVFQR